VAAKRAECLRLPSAWGRWRRRLHAFLKAAQHGSQEHSSATTTTESTVYYYNLAPCAQVETKWRPAVILCSMHLSLSSIHCKLRVRPWCWRMAGGVSDGRCMFSWHLWLVICAPCSFAESLSMAAEEPGRRTCNHKFKQNAQRLPTTRLHLNNPRVSPSPTRLLRQCADAKMQDCQQILAIRVLESQCQQHDSESVRTNGAVTAVQSENIQNKGSNP
jgi:hypothetical protein